MILKQERQGVGGTLLIVTGAILAFTMIWSVTFLRMATAKSVAESVEHTIALQCLAACYLNPQSEGTTSTEGFITNSNRVFKLPYGGTVDPLSEFNKSMTAYGLGLPADKIWMKYEPKDTHAGSPAATFEIMVYGWKLNQAGFFDKIVTINPQPAKVTVEGGYGVYLQNSGIKGKNK